jgi:hypothetical protein
MGVKPVVPGLAWARFKLSFDAFALAALYSDAIFGVIS